MVAMIWGCSFLIISATEAGPGKSAMGEPMIIGALPELALPIASLLPTSPTLYIALAMASTGTEKLKLGTGVTNPFTRHPAVTAIVAGASPRLDRYAQ